MMRVISLIVSQRQERLGQSLCFEVIWEDK
jgi:hypothetical protein